ncbi:MAG: PAS domain S-box protein, partial [Candidatus Omnitrophica bacterium]|nr:PAS domain S-box protein [Candidatus Omnitrophota bacterium]
MEPDQLAAVSGGYFGWTIPLNYQPVHDCLKELNLAPYRNYGKVTPMMAIRQYWIGLLFAGFIFLLLITGIMVAARLNQRLLSSQDRLKKEMLARQTISDSLINKEEQYRTLFESSRSPIMIIANNGDYLNANTAALEFLECGRDELLTKNMKEHIAPELMPEIVPDSSKAGEESKGVEAEYIVNGSSKALTLNSTPFVWEKKPAVILVGNDISTRRMTEKLLRESEEKFRRLTQELAQGQEATINILEDLQEAKEVLEASRENFLNIVENSTDGIAVVDHKNFILFLNAAATELFGQPAEILLGTRLHVLIDSREAKEVEIIAGQQTARTVEVKAVETQWEGEFAYLVLLHDITERKNAERALRLAAREWRTTFDAIGDGVAVLNRNATVMRCNKTLTGLLGKGFKDIIGCDAHALMHAGKIQQENEKCSIQAMFETSRREKRIMNIDSRWFSVVVDPLFDERKHLIGAVHIMRDITEQKKIENNLIEETKFIESIVETAQALIVVLSRDFGVIGVNTFCENTLGYKRDEIIGKPWIGHFVPLDYQEELKKILTNCLAGTKIKGHEIPVLTREGAEVFISWHSAELKNAAGENIGIVSMGYDITQRKEIEKVQRLAQLGTLVSHMAHEVNNPLMIISGRAQIALAEKIENKEVERDMQVIINECQRAKDIIQRLLRFSRPSKGEIKLVDINQALDEVISLVEHQFGLANVRLGKNYQAGLPQVLADERQLHEVFMNLLTNAKDAIENEGGIEITTTAENSQVIIRFRDSGAGMSKELISKVFDPFFTTKEKGTGLGLSICYSIIKTHGGELQFESEPGKGTTVTIVLPVEQETVN